MAGGSSRRESSSRWIVILAVLIVVSVVASIVFISRMKNKAVPEKVAVKMDKPATADNPNIITKKATEKYREQYFEDIKRKEKKALESGETYAVPKMVLGDEEAEKRRLQLIEEESRIRQRRERQTARQQQIHNALLMQRFKRLESILARADEAYAAAWPSGIVNAVYVPDNGYEESKDSDIDSRTLRALAAVKTEEAPEWLTTDIENALKPGNILYASIDLNLDSDKARNGFILSTVLAGPLRGSKLFGSFTQDGQSLSFRIEYKMLQMPNGVSIPIHAFAVDPNAKMPFLVDEVNHHYLVRWGSLVAQSFLEGAASFAKATAQSGTQTASSVGAGGGVVIQSTPHFSVTERSLIAAGTVANRLASEVGKNFKIPPTVKVFATAEGKSMPVGILILDSPFKKVYGRSGLLQQAMTDGNKNRANTNQDWSTSPHQNDGDNLKIWRRYFDSTGNNR